MKPEVFTEVPQVRIVDETIRSSLSPEQEQQYLALRDQELVTHNHNAGRPNAEKSTTDDEKLDALVIATNSAFAVLGFERPGDQNE